MPKSREIIFISVLFLLLTVFLTFPLVTHFSTHLVGDQGDSWQNAWNMWWMNKSLTELFSNPYHTDYLHYPNGVTLAFQTMNPFNALLSIPLQHLFNLFVAYNTMFFLSFVLSGLGMYLLALYLTNDKRAAFLAGCIFVFCPYRMGHSLGHLHLVSTQFIPFFIFFLMKSVDTKKTSNTIFATICLVLAAMCSWYYLFFCGFFAVLYLVFIFCTNKALCPSAFKKVAVIFIGTIIIISPLLIGMLKETLNSKFLGAHMPDKYSADILSYFLPSWIQSLGRFNIFDNITSQFTGNVAENSNYIGYSVMFLSILSLIRRRKKNIIINFLFICGIIFLILSLGMHPHLKGGAYTSITLPYKILYDHFFFFQFTGMPERFHVMLMLCLSLLSAFGLKALFSSAKPGKQNIIFIVFIFVILAEYVSLPSLVTTYESSSFFEAMRHDKEDYGVIYLPPNKSKTLYYQTIHNKKMVSGYISRLPVTADDYIKSTPIIHNLVNGEYPVKINGEVISDENAKVMTQNMFQDLGIRYILLEKGEENLFLEKARFPVVHTDSIVTVYKP